jgi:hypothetical protein
VRADRVFAAARWGRRRTAPPASRSPRRTASRAVARRRAACAARAARPARGGRAWARRRGVAQSLPRLARRRAGSRSSTSGSTGISGEAVSGDAAVAPLIACRKLMSIVFRLEVSNFDDPQVALATCLLQGVLEVVLRLTAPERDAWVKRVSRVRLRNSQTAQNQARRHLGRPWLAGPAIERPCKVVLGHEFGSSSLQRAGRRRQAVPRAAHRAARRPRAPPRARPAASCCSLPGGSRPPSRAGLLRCRTTCKTSEGASPATRCLPAARGNLRRHPLSPCHVGTCAAASQVTTAT